MDKINNTQSKEENKELINLRQLFEQYSYYWKWFILSVVIAFIGAFFYLRYAQSNYSVNAKILLKDEKSGSSELSGLSELAGLTGMKGTPAFVSDQIDVFSSRRLMRKVVDANKLNIYYFNKGNFKTSEVMAKKAPFNVTLISNPDSIYLNLSVNLLDNGKLSVENLLTGKKQEFSYSVPSKIEGKE